MMYAYKVHADVSLIPKIFIRQTSVYNDCVHVLLTNHNQPERHREETSFPRYSSRGHSHKTKSARIRTVTLEVVFDIIDCVQHILCVPTTR